MQCGGAVYARVPADGAARLDEAIRKVRTRPERGPLGVLLFTAGEHEVALVDRWGKSDDMPHWSEGPDLTTAAELAALSRQVGEVTAYYEVDDGDSFGVYGAWRDGALVRSLVRMDGEWQTAEGAPQAWEALLFDAPALERALSDAREDGEDEAAVREAFAAGHIMRGGRWPRPPVLRALLAGLRAPADHGRWPKRREALQQLAAPR